MCVRILFRPNMIAELMLRLGVFTMSMIAIIVYASLFYEHFKIDERIMLHQGYTLCESLLVLTDY